MSGTYDVVVIGAGHNGLTAAALLAKDGRKVLVVERGDRVGGLAASEEFHPGYRTAGLLQDTTGVWSRVVDDLDLERHGLRRLGKRPAVLALGEGRGMLLPGDPAAAADEIRPHSARDADRYLEYRALISKFRGVLNGFLREPPLDLIRPELAGPWELLKRALRLRRVGGAEMLELLRLPPMAVADWLDEWFEDDLLKAALALPAIAGTSLGPRSPGGTANLLLWEAAAEGAVGPGGHSLIAALEASARGHGVELRTGAAVRRILTDGSAVRGVELEGGEEVRARVVAASCDPKRTLLELLPPMAISSRLERRVRSYRTTGTTAHVRLALSVPLRFACRGEAPVELARTGDRLDRLELAHDALKYGRLPETPILEIHAPAVACPELAPAGHAVVSILVHFAPYDLRPAWDDVQRERLASTVLSILEAHAPGASSSVVAQEVLTPVDLETRYGLSGGHIHHGEHSLDQRLVRPAPGCTGYRTPVEGLYLCGAGSHPGGGLTCVPGALAASTILRR
jgi:phytoene dehydrogenase-like protein